MFTKFALLSLLACSTAFTFFEFAPVAVSIVMRTANFSLSGNGAVVPRSRYEVTPERSIALKWSGTRSAVWK